MSLEIGTKLAHYEILEPIGKGGMGEVYRANDSKLGRDVAIKVLPDEFAENDERLARFRREAKVLASLNHPGIAAIHGLEQSEGTHYLVLELVPGETLAERIARGPIPVEEALQIAVKIAEALEQAHEQGIVHRDLKPANIKLTPDDKVKVLDFGLAKEFVEEAPEADSSMSPTVTRGTQLGVILGTASYMSPEQAKGKRVDKRTDIFAFGAVLYEVLTGKKAFPGEDASEVLAAVIKGAPDWNELPTEAPVSLRRVLRRSLIKDPGQRLRDIGDARLELAEDTLETVGEPPGGRVISSSWGARLASLVLGGLVAGTVAWGLWPTPKAPSTTRLSLDVPGTSAPQSLSPVLSPDGRRLVFVANNQLYVRTLDEFGSAPIPGSEGGRGPFFSPDGEWLGFFTTTTLRKVRLDGSTPETLARVREGQVGSWGPNDCIFFEQEGNVGISQVASSGGTPSPFTSPSDGETAHWDPHVLPGGDAVLFSVLHGPSDELKLFAQSTTTNEKTLVLNDALSGRYVSSGHIVFNRDGGLFAAIFNLVRGEVIGTPVRVVDNVLLGRRIGRFSVSDEGTLAYLPGSAAGLFGAGPSRLTWVDDSGHSQPLGLEQRAYAAPRVSPDGTRLSVVVVDQGNTDLWLVDPAMRSSSRFTFDPSFAWAGVWTSDGRRIVFDSSRSGTLNLYMKATDGTGPVEQLTDSRSLQHPLSISRDDTLLFEEQRVADGTWDIISLSLHERKRRALLNTKFSERAAALSTDGHWLAYQSDASERDEIYVRPFPDVSAGLWQVSNEGGKWPAWSHDASVLYFLSDAGMMSVDVETEPAFRAGPSQLLFDTKRFVVDDQFYRPFDVSPDGRQLLMLEAASSIAPTGPAKIHVVINWFHELERLIPADN